MRAVTRCWRRGRALLRRDGPAASLPRRYCTDAGGEEKGGGFWERTHKVREVAEEGAAVKASDVAPPDYAAYVGWTAARNHIDVQEMLSRDGLPGIQNICADLKAHQLQEKLTDEALWFLVLAGWLPEMRKLSVRVIHQEKRAAMFSKMVAFLAECRDAWGSKTFASLIHAASAVGLTQEAVRWYKEAIREGLLSRYVMPSLIYALAAGGDIERAGDVHRWVHSRGIRNEDLRAWIFANSKVGNWRDAQFFFDLLARRKSPVEPGEDLPETSKHPTDDRLWTTLLAAYARGLNYEGAAGVYARIHRMFKLTDVHVTAYVSAHSTGGVVAFNKARVLLMGTRFVYSTSVFNAYMKVMVRLAESLKPTESRLKWQKDDVEFSLGPVVEDRPDVQITRMRAQKLQYTSERFWSLYDIMKENPKLRPDAITYLHAMKFAQCTKDPPKATMVLQDAEAAGITHIVYHTLAISTYARRLDLRGTVALVHDARAKQLNINNVGTQSAILQGLLPGRDTSHAKSVIQVMVRNKIDPDVSFLAYAVRAFGTPGSTEELVDACRTIVERCRMEDRPEDFVLDSPWLLHCLERAFTQPLVLNAFRQQFPDFFESCHEVILGPVQQIQCPRDGVTSLEGMRDHFTITSRGRTIRVLTDEWLLPLGSRLQDFIEDSLGAGDIIVVPFYCLMRIGQLARRGKADLVTRKSAHEVITALQDLYDVAAKNARQGLPANFDTVYFDEQLHALPQLQNLLNIQEVPKNTQAYFDEVRQSTNIVYDRELRVPWPVQSTPTVKSMARRSLAVAALLQQFQHPGVRVNFCARDPEVVRLAQKIGLDTTTVEDVLGAEWWKRRRDSMEKLLLEAVSEYDDTRLLGGGATGALPETSS
eukprot:TRINITY_DN36014_c0_g1_i1.p1 TRINITY_DN36014_c0_g1~~TRINITY_DN36014_c0_g1_i1.p1  ORF type:complete len:875 (+),score=278.91 TRINITY_DN36014_c0_g1_i1:85-2709(+)